MNICWSPCGQPKSELDSAWVFGMNSQLHREERSGKELGQRSLLRHDDNCEIVEKVD